MWNPHGLSYAAAKGHEFELTHQLGYHQVGKRVFLQSPGTVLAWVWDRPGAFSCFGRVHLPTNPFIPLARLPGLFGLAPPNFDFYGHVLPPPMPPPIWKQKAGRTFLSSNNLAGLASAQRKNLPLPSC